MPKFKVKGWVQYRSTVCTSVEVEAETPEEARERVLEGDLLNANILNDDIGFNAEVYDLEIEEVVEVKEAA